MHHHVHMHADLQAGPGRQALAGRQEGRKAGRKEGRQADRQTDRQEGIV